MKQTNLSYIIVYNEAEDFISSRKQNCCTAYVRRYGDEKIETIRNSEDDYTGNVQRKISWN